jgi:ubiquinone/menaquinone biosynthesis C-methylase UbiE
MNNDPLQRRYRGANAKNYDTRRLSSTRGQAESVAFTRLFQRASPRSVFDCPFGTGRWIDWYRALPGPIIAFDLSGDMLAVAKAKLESAPLPNIILAQGDIRYAELECYRRLGIDLVVCTRFLNWVSPEDTKKVIAKLATLRSRHAIIGASVRPKDGTWPMRKRMQFRFWLRKVRSQKKAKQYVHDEQFILEAFETYQWHVVAKEFIFENPTRRNYFYLVERR